MASLQSPSTLFDAQYITMLASPIIRRNAKKSVTPPSFIHPDPEMVTILVGPEKKKFIVHQEFLTFHSKYFAAALQGNFTEATTKTFELDHTTVEIFGLLVQWIYTKDISQQVSVVDASDLNSRLKGANTLRNLVDLWILADYLQIPKLQNTTLDLLKSLKKKFIDEDTFTHIWSSTTTKSPLRKYFVDLFAWGSSSRVVESHPEVFPLDMLVSIIKELRRKTTPDCQVPTKLSDYYVNVNTEQQEG